MGIPKTVSVHAPTEADQEAVQTALQVLSEGHFTESSQNLILEIPQNHRDNLRIELPASFSEIILELIRETAAGKQVQLITEHAEITTEEAAHILNVSRPHIIKLLECGKIPYRTVGKHRRVELEGLLQYREQNRHRKHQVLDELTALGQEMDG